MRPIRRFIAAMAVFSGTAQAQSIPAVGLFEQIPVLYDSQGVKARPNYILTDTPLHGPTVFSGLQLIDDKIEVVCCFEVTQPTPLSMRGEIAKYGGELHFTAVFEGIKGYRYIYRAQPVAKRRWNRAMASLMRERRTMNDGYPYSLGVIAATFDKAVMPQTFEAGGANTRYSYRYPEDSERVIHTFVQGKRKVEFSEDTYGGAAH